jgi:tRNA(Ile)-lysidine synthase
MAASRKRPNAEAAVAAQLARAGLRGKRVAVGLSGGMDSVVLLHILHGLAPALGFRLSAIHVNHGLSPNAGAWQSFCASVCRALPVPFKAVKVNVDRRGRGLEAAAREARRAALSGARADVIALAHHQDDQAETVLFNLLRGAGLAGASGMPARGTLGRKLLLRPLLEVPRSAIHAHALQQRLGWIEDESNDDEAMTRNFLRRRVGPLLATRFPRWRANLARAARHFAGKELGAERLLRSYLKGKGLRAPGEARLAEMLKQLASGSAAVAHEGKLLRVYRRRVFLEDNGKPPPAFKPQSWNGEPRLELPALGGELRFRRVRGRGIASERIEGKRLQVRVRSGGERLRTDARRPSRTLKNLFQEAGVPPWQRRTLPLLYCGRDLVWVPGLGVDAKFLSAGGAPGVLPDWKPFPPSAA